jgi:hypothetical protein
VIGRIMTLITAMQVLLGGVAVVTLLAAASMSIQERLRELSVLHALGCTTTQLAGASAVSQGALGAIGVALGLPLGLGTYLLFKAMSGGGFTGSSPWRPSPSPPAPAPAPPCSPNASRPTRPSPPNSPPATRGVVRAARDSNPNRQIRSLVLLVHGVVLSAVCAAQVTGRIQLGRQSAVW